MRAFNEFLTTFKASARWATMAATVEASPWHREANVAVHTEMTLDQYRSRFAGRHGERADLVAMVALLFHDTGKPAAEETVEKKDGSGETYRRYAGHEQASAVTFLEWYVGDPQLRALLTPSEARAVRWIVEHHLPYALKDPQKRRGLRTATHHTLEAAGIDPAVFFDCLRADAAGRVSDDHEAKLTSVETWIEGFSAIDWVPLAPAPLVALDAPPTTFLLCGPSGAGKSTFVRTHRRPGDQVISMDDLKLEFYEHERPAEAALLRAAADAKARYDAAWEHARAHEGPFGAFERTRTAHLPTAKQVFIDLTNLSRKARRRWVDQATRAGHRVVGVEFWNTFETLLARQTTRSEKCVPAHALSQQVDAQALCWLGHEVDGVITTLGAAP